MIATYKTTLEPCQRHWIGSLLLLDASRAKPHMHGKTLLIILTWLFFKKKIIYKIIIITKALISGKSLEVRVSNGNPTKLIDSQVFNNGCQQEYNQTCNL